MLSDGILSFIRTYVPIAVGALGAWLLTLGIELSGEAQAGLIVFLTGAFQAAYYALARLLENRWPFFGVLLGSTQKPHYTQPVEPPIEYEAA